MLKETILEVSGKLHATFKISGSIEVPGRSNEPRPKDIVAGSPASPLTALKVR